MLNGSRLRSCPETSPPSSDSTLRMTSCRAAFTVAFLMIVGKLYVHRKYMHLSIYTILSREDKQIMFLKRLTLKGKRKEIKRGK